MKRPSIFLVVRCQSGTKILIGPTDTYQKSGVEFTPLCYFTNIMGGPFYMKILIFQLIRSANLYGECWGDNDLKHITRVVAKENSHPIVLT